MPRGIYKRKGRKAKTQGRTAKHGRKVFLCSKEAMAQMRFLGDVAEPPTTTFVVEILQTRRVAVYVKAREIAEANHIANEFVHRNKKITGDVVVPGAVVTQMRTETRGIGTTADMAFDHENKYAKAFESPVQKVWNKPRGKKKADEFAAVENRPSYKILPVRAK